MSITDHRALPKTNFDSWRITQLLPIAIRAFPKLRVGEIIDNAIMFVYDNDRCAQDLFSISDYDLANALIEYLREHKVEVRTI